MYTYKGFVGKVKFDEKANVLFGKVINTRDVITFQSKEPEKIEQEFRNSIDDYLEFCEELGREPEKPYSGKFVLRLTPEEHKKVSMAAYRDNKSLNSWISETITKSAENST